VRGVWRADAPGIHGQNGSDQGIGKRQIRPVGGDERAFYRATAFEWIARSPSEFCDLHHRLIAAFLIPLAAEGVPMKTPLIDIALSGRNGLASQFAAEVTDCPQIVWKDGHHVCSIVEND